MKHAQQVGNDKVDISIIEHEKKDAIRLNKYISNSGYCSRREADRFIAEGKVSIDGVQVEVGTKVYSHQLVNVNGFEIKPEIEHVYIALYKPSGITCTTDTKDADNIIDFMKYGERIFPIGRLDKDSSGLILLSNDGDIVNKVLRSTYEHEKQYIVKVDKTITETFVEHMQNGVKIYNPVHNQYQITKSCKIEKIDNRVFSIILTEGLNRQIRRMCTALSYHVISLQRTRFMNISLGDMKAGEWRYLREDELMKLNEAIQK